MMGSYLKLLLLAIVCSVLPLYDAWRILHPQTSKALGNNLQPSIRYGYASARLGDAWIITHGYFYDDRASLPRWLSDTWSLDVYAPYEFTQLRAGIPREQAKKAYNAGKHPHSPYGRFGAASAAHGNSIYLHGGQDGGHSKHDKEGYEPGYEFDEFWRFDLSSKAWTHITPAGESPGSRHLHTMVTIGDHLYLYGGNAPGQGDVWQYDIANKRWQQIAPELDSTHGGPGRRAGHKMLSLANHNGRTGFIIIGGRFFKQEDSFDLVNDVWFFDLTTKHWQLLPASSGSSPAPRMYFGADWVTVKHSVHSAQIGIIMGGTTRIPSVQCASDTWAFALDCNLTRVSWSKLQDHIYGIYDHQIGAVDDVVFSFGGHLCTSSKGRLPFWYVNQVNQLKVYWTTLEGLDYCSRDGLQYWAKRRADKEL